MRVFSLTGTDPGQLCLGLTRRNEFAPGKASSGVAVGVFPSLDR